jgi:hypothetical protein
MQRTREAARSQGYVETVFGRRLYLPEINAKNPQRRQGAERAAINAPMQGTAADLIKLAMIAVQGWLEREKLASRLLLQVHDELILEVPKLQTAPRTAGAHATDAQVRCASASARAATSGTPPAHERQSGRVVYANAPPYFFRLSRISRSSTTSSGGAAGAGGGAAFFSRLSCLTRTKTMNAR